MRFGFEDFKVVCFATWRTKFVKAKHSERPIEEKESFEALK